MSIGSSMFPYFLKWVESPKGGNGGSSWTNDHIESFMDIAGPMMGVPKALTCMISGETHDTMALGSMGAYVLEKFFSRRERTKLMRSWFGGSSMLPKGGEAVWGTKDNAPDDEKEEEYHSFGNMLSFVPHPEGMDQDSNETPSNSEDPLIRNYTVTESLDLMLKNADFKYNSHLAANYSFGVTTSKRQLEKNDNDPTKWSNPLESRLPNAPDMKIYCFYGVGVPTERSYYYAVANEEDEETCAGTNTTTGCTHEETTEHQTEQPITAFAHHPIPTKPVNLYIDASVSDPIQRIETGIRFSDG
ncbi:hypothetical protein K501DRAFT_280347, partial [Backusella circina FSU 941]